MKTKILKLTLGIACAFCLMFAGIIGLMPNTNTVYADSRTVETVDTNGLNGHLHFNLSSTGVLTWTEVDGATSYDVTAYLSDELELNANVTTNSFDLIDFFDSKKKEHGTYDICVTAKGVICQDYFLYTYVSPYDKLESPVNLRWNGNTAEWNSVTNATSYYVTLIKSCKSLLRY